MERSLSAIVFAGMLAFASASYSYAGGMPADILGKVKASIESRYPNDYSMQKALITNQVKSYEFLQTYAPSSVPSNVLEKIKNEISSRYPDDYSMQKALIMDQVKSYRYLNKKK